jgi:hypothetical protein
MCMIHFHAAFQMASINGLLITIIKQKFKNRMAAILYFCIL